MPYTACPAPQGVSFSTTPHCRGAVGSGVYPSAPLHCRGQRYFVYLRGGGGAMVLHLPPLLCAVCPVPHSLRCWHLAVPPRLGRYWSCCPKKKALDWEEFQALPTCTVGRCCSEATVELFKPSAAQTETVAPMTEAEIKQMEAPPPPPAPVVAEDKPGPIVDGKARCRNKGCTVDWFVVADNHPEACHYHVGGPVFHDTAKYWSCCSHKKCFDWDDFMKVPTCTVGPHKV